MSVLRIEPETDPHWRALLAAHGGSLFHSPPWLGSLADAYGFGVYAYVLTDQADRPVAGLPFCRITDLVGERLVSLPFSDYCDPLVTSAAAWQALFREIEALCLPTTFRCLEASAATADSRLEVRKCARWHGMDLDADLDTLWGRLAASTRRAVRRAEREGVVVETLGAAAVLDAFVRLHVTLRKHKYRLLAPPRLFFEAIHRRFAAVDGWFPLAACHRGQVIAVTIYLRWNDTLYYKFNASSRQALALRPNDALMWAGIQLARRLGCRRLDLGASDDDQPGLIRFKRQYGAQEREIRVLRYLPPNGDEVQPAQMRALLARLTQVYTDPAVPDDVTRDAGAAVYRLFA